MMTTLISDSWNDSTAAEPSVNTTERPLEFFPLYIAAQNLKRVCPPFILLFGIFGNVMIIIIMRRIASGQSAIHMYFIATAVFDLICLCSNTLVEWIRFALGFNISPTHTVVCKIYTWLYTGSSTISAWCLVSMTVHRAMSVMWPHRINVLCTRRKVLLLIIGIAVFFALLYSHYLIGFERLFVTSLKEYRCSVRSDNDNYIYFLENIFLYVELSVYSILPFTFLVMSNGVLVWKLMVSVKGAKSRLTEGDSEKVQSREKAASSVTLTVIVVSLAFIVLCLPDSMNFVLNYLAISHDRVSGYQLAKTVFTDAFCILLGQTNSAVNFYLYVLTGRRFREEFLKIMCCGRNRRRGDASS